MWPFASRGSRDVTAPPEFKDLPPFDAFANNDSVLKVWLTEKLSDRINWLSERRDTSRPDVLRAILFEHLYGRIAYEALLAHVTQRNVAEELARARTQASREARAGRDLAAALHGATVGISDEIQHSRREETPIDIRFVGKALDDFKLYLPLRLKEDLKSIAKIHGLTASSYVRKMLVLQLLGERLHTDWLKAIGKIPAEIIEMERD